MEVLTVRQRDETPYKRSYTKTNQPISLTLPKAWYEKSGKRCPKTLLSQLCLLITIKIGGRTNTTQSFNFTD